jgi:large subunit ribosomal protein L15
MTKADTAHVRTSELALIPNEVIDLLALKAANIVSGTVKNAKIYLSGDVAAKYNIQGLLLTKGARAAIEAAGGKVLEAA